jgi:deoxyribodipyrimidine photolyase
VPVYCFDPRHFAKSEYGPMKTGVQRANFMIEAVSDLRARLQAVGCDLAVFHSQPENVLPTLMLQGKASLPAVCSSACLPRPKLKRMASVSDLHFTDEHFLDAFLIKGVFTEKALLTLQTTVLCIDEPQACSCTVRCRFQTPCSHLEPFGFVFLSNLSSWSSFFSRLES